MKRKQFLKPTGVFLAILILSITSLTNTPAIASYSYSNVQSSYSSEMSSSDLCSVAGIALIVGAVGVGLQMVESAYNLGTYIGDKLSGNQIQLVNIHDEDYQPTDFTIFDI
ncbi:hypothetical protein ACFOUP_18205 [Belliella kenyensis]|uniref:Uncharacterized protein n=1 Tax=Belliella kenyensis TaxID=1472724 RepID=A0ABV8ET77_9BACT|nr:hypothetical protein [Belliella kenyensis]MCH7402284.1 hypothetical protein [Belliella kenyensis]MDN3601801.1 hypothetical protein [Belliella kenyensis]